MPAHTHVQSVCICGWNITRSHRNGGAGYFRALCRVLASHGVAVTFLQPAAEDPADLPPGQPYTVREYRHPCELPALLPAAAETLICKFLDRAPEEDAVLAQLLAGAGRVWLADGDAPDTLAHLSRPAGAGVRTLLPACAGVLLLTGGPRAAACYRRLGARRTARWYAAADPCPLTDASPTVDALFIGNPDPGRDARVEAILFGAAAARPQYSFLLIGDGWTRFPRLPNLQVIGHRPPEALPSYYQSARAVINLTRASQRQWGYCPSMRLFEAAAVGATVISDSWPGMASCFTPDQEVLIADTPAALAAQLDRAMGDTARAVGRAMHARLCRQHTWRQRIGELWRVVGMAEA